MYRQETQAPSAVLKTIRKKLKMSQRDMAQLLGTEQSWLSKAERGVVTPDWLLKFALLMKLARDAGLDFEDVALDFPEPVSSMARESGAEYKVD